MFRWIKRVLVLLVLTGVAAWLHHYLPRHAIVQISGTDVVRMDVGTTTDTAGNSVAVSRDVRFINAFSPAGDPLVFRNEDTGWSFPFYFKFSSGDIQAQAQNLVSTRTAPEWVAITFYGWRLDYFSWFPNAISIREATGPDETIVPWFNIAFLSVLAVVALWLVYRIRRFREERVEPFLEETASDAAGLWGRIRRTVGGR